MAIINCSETNISNILEVSMYGQMEKISNTLSKARLRIFYTGENRNHTFISKNFAEKLIQTLPYTPVKGIFDYTESDYEGHEEDDIKTEERIYGIVPENPNFAWETNIDEDGVEREYATADVYLFTSLYPEAKLIQGKSQSMELFRNSLRGEWRNNEKGIPTFYFSDGEFLGLQILGDNVEPCFEGSAFFSLYKNSLELANYIKNFIEKQEDDEVNKEKILAMFRLSDNDKWHMIFNQLNPNFEKDWEVNYHIVDVYDDYAVCYNIETSQHERVVYTKGEDTVTLGERTIVKIVDVTETEYKALEAMKNMNGDTFEKVDENYSNIKTEKEKVENEFSTIKETKEKLEIDFAAEKTTHKEVVTDFTTKIEKLEKEISEEKVKFENLSEEKNKVEKEKNDLLEEKQILEIFKLNKEKDEKMAILNNFEETISEEVYNKYKEKIAEFSVEDFKKELCTAAFEADPTIFNKKEDSTLIFKGNNQKEKLTGAAALIAKHKTGGNK